MGRKACYRSFFAFAAMAVLVLFFTSSPTLADTQIQRPLRLSAPGKYLLNPYGHRISLHGAQLDAPTEAQADLFAQTYNFNLARVMIKYTPEYRDNATASGVNAKMEQQIDDAIRFMSARHVWVVLELRVDDVLANSAALYDPSSPEFAGVLKTWLYFAAKYKNTDYIAAWGLLAEPSPEKSTSVDPRGDLIRFYKKLMDEITTTVGDTRTLFSVGTSWNYDTMEYRYPDYYFGFEQYKGRLLYAVNYLMPKPWIDFGKYVNDSIDHPTYPFNLGDNVDYDTLIQPKEDERRFLPAHDNLESIFNTRKQEPENFNKMMTRNFIGWYLQWPLAFRDAFNVPIWVDQYGASTQSSGQLAYEADLINFFVAHNIASSRWSFNAGTAPRYILGNPDVEKFYQDLAPTWHKPRN